MLRKRELPRKLAPQGRQLTRLGLPRHLLLHRKASPKLWGAPVSLVWCNIYKVGHEQQGCGACSGQHLIHTLLQTFLRGLSSLQPHACNLRPWLS